MTRTVHFNFRANFPPERQWTVQMLVPRREMPELCQALEEVVLTKLGGFYYYPRLKPDTTRCRYEWFIRLRHDPYGLRMTLQFDLRNEALTTVDAWLSLGPDQVGKTELITRHVERRAERAIEEVLYYAGRIVEGAGLETYYPIYHFQLPTGSVVDHDVGDDRVNASRSALERRSGKDLFCVSVRCDGYSYRAAEARGSADAGRLATLMTVLVGEEVKKTTPKLPKRMQRREWKAVPSGSDIHQAPRFVHRDSSVLTMARDVSSRVATAVRLCQNTALVADEALWRAACAVATGIILEKDHPTVASVAYVAALATLASESPTCDGEVTCSKCGPRQPHGSMGEVQLISEALAEGLRLSDEKVKDAQRLVSRVYGQHRSAYVHDAKLRHSEGENPSLNLGRPGEDSLLRRELIFKEDSRSIADLARRLLLVRLGELDSEVLNLEPDLFSDRLQFAIPVTVGINVGKRPVGLGIGP